MESIEHSMPKRPRAGYARGAKPQPRIDMTPMVDLGFLLICFFVLTKNLSTPMITKLKMPADRSIIDSSQLPKSLALTLLLDENNMIYYYHGDWSEAIQKGEIGEAGYSNRNGIGGVIRQKQKAIDDSGKFPGGRNEMMVLIKPAKNASYGNVMDAIDELLINVVEKYAIIELAKEEMNYLKLKKENKFN